MRGSLVQSAGGRLGFSPLTMMRPSTLVSVFSKSQTCILCLLCRNLKIRFCAGEGRVRDSAQEKEVEDGLGRTRARGDRDARSAGS